MSADDDCEANAAWAMKEIGALRKRVAALEKERDAALADNAALVENARTERQMLFMLYHRIKAMGLRNEAMTDAVTTVERWMDVVPDTYEQPHPGAALLEEHRKALVRVRNEGLERAAAGCDAKAAIGRGWETWAEAARTIRAMKEPESD